MDSSIHTSEVDKVIFPAGTHLLSEDTDLQLQLIGCGSWLINVFDIPVFQFNLMIDFCLTEAKFCFAKPAELQSIYGQFYSWHWPCAAEEQEEPFCRTPVPCQAVGGRLKAGWDSTAEVVSKLRRAQVFPPSRLRVFCLY